MWLVIGLTSICAIPAADAYAWGGGHGGYRHGHGHDRHTVVVVRPRREVVVYGRRRYVYDGRRFHHPGFWGGFFAVRPAFGIIVATLPFGHAAVVIGGTRYYHYDDVYYRECPSGYIVVPKPPVYVLSSAAGTVAADGETVTINVPNSNGSFTPVRLTKADHGYRGPQGEFYPGRPTVDQLKALYGS